MPKHPHSWVLHRALSRQMCSHCGLVWLRNPCSNAAASAACRWWDD